MSSIRRSISIAAVGLLAAGTVSASLYAGPAYASPAECVNGANGFVSIAYNKTGTVVSGKTVDLGGSRRAELHSGTINGAQRGWAIIRGATQAGDQVWMDWTTTSGNGWLQCGPFSVQSNGSPNTSAAKSTSSASGYWFRACGKIAGGTSKCGAWW